MTELTREVIVAASGEFSLDTVFTLSLAKKGIRIKPVLGKCPNLKNLDLSQNDLQNLLADYKRIDKMDHLKFLDLRKNSIQNLESLPDCERLQILHLEGNKISDFRHLEILQTRAPRLRHLYLNDPLNNLTNPICSKTNYAAGVLKLFPKLEVLDGMRLKYEFSLYKLGLSLEKEMKDENNRTDNVKSAFSNEESTTENTVDSEEEAAFENEIRILKECITEFKELQEQGVTR
eukprot:CAMPEP_0184489864 /NCGR_PEP_ID=MMETSP0113_2-20130426/16524_1 /TAXON_ID=91329 /ORGANISM="Norrisiella sphaerica, Strain BC52" /LENGTH=232 /DNA_ID=CAMNT_0026873507 /DNA_START=249 /DNA_END=947 /DNA_ORIENTATION=+